MPSVVYIDLQTNLSLSFSLLSSRMRMKRKWSRTRRGSLSLSLSLSPSASPFSYENDEEHVSMYTYIEGTRRMGGKRGDVNVGEAKILVRLPSTWGKNKGANEWGRRPAWGVMDNYGW